MTLDTLLARIAVPAALLALLIGVSLAQPDRDIDYASAPAGAPVMHVGFGDTRCTMPAGPAGYRIVACPGAASGHAATSDR